MSFCGMMTNSAPAPNPALPSSNALGVLGRLLWGSVVNDDYDSNYIDAHIKNIRKKLNVYESPEWLETVRGLGYRINL